MAMISQEEFENYAKDLIKKSGIYACHIKTVRYEGTRFIESSFKAEHLIIILQRDNKTDCAWLTSESDLSTYYYFQ